MYMIYFNVSISQVRSNQAFSCSAMWLNLKQIDREYDGQ